jgi:hypothetical protein
MPSSTVCISESEIDGESVEECLKNSIKNIQDGLNHVQMHMMKMIESDTIDCDQWTASHMVNIELKNLVLELIAICKEIRPKSFKALKVSREKIAGGIDQFEKSGEGL